MELVDEAIERIVKAEVDVILLAIGLDDSVENEGRDRENIMLPDIQLYLAQKASTSTCLPLNARLALLCRPSHRTSVFCRLPSSPSHWSLLFSTEAPLVLTPSRRIPLQSLRLSTLAFSVPERLQSYCSENTLLPANSRTQSTRNPMHKR